MATLDRFCCKILLTLVAPEFLLQYHSHNRILMPEIRMGKTTLCMLNVEYHILTRQIGISVAFTHVRSSYLTFPYQHVGKTKINSRTSAACWLQVDL